MPVAIRRRPKPGPVFLRSPWEQAVDNAFGDVLRRPDRVLVYDEIIRTKAEAKFTAANCSVLGRWGRPEVPGQRGAVTTDNAANVAIYAERCLLAIKALLIDRPVAIPDKLNL